MAGFSPILAFGAGLAGGAENALAAKNLQQQKQDDVYRDLALKTSFEEQNEDYKAKKIQQEGTQFSNDADAKLGLSKANTTNQSTFDAVKQAQINPSITQATGSPPPTNTPQTSVSPGTAPIQGQGQIQQTNLAPPAGMQGNPPQQNTQIQSPAQTPQQGDATNPLAPPNAQQNDNVNPTGGTVSPNTPEDIVSTYQGTPLTRSDAAVIKGYAAEETGKSKGFLSTDNAIAVGFARWKDDQAKNNKSEAAYTGDKDEVNKANQLGVPLVKDPGFYKLDAKAQLNVQEADTKRIFGSQDEQRDIAKLPYFIDQLKELYTLNGAITTGNLKALPGALQTDVAINGADAVYNKITSQLAILSRAPGLGRMSVAELTADQNAFASLKVPNSANNAIILTRLAGAQRDQEKVDYQKAFISANHRYDDAVAEKAWNAYDKANPVLDMSNPLDPKPLPYVSRENWMRGVSTPDTDIMSNEGRITHGLNVNGTTPPQAKPKVISVDKSGNPKFDFSGY